MQTLGCLVQIHSDDTNTWKGHMKYTQIQTQNQLNYSMSSLQSDQTLSPERPDSIRSDLTSYFFCPLNAKVKISLLYEATPKLGLPLSRNIIDAIQMWHCTTINKSYSVNRQKTHWQMILMDFHPCLHSYSILCCVPGCVEFETSSDAMWSVGRHLLWRTSALRTEPLVLWPPTASTSPKETSNGFRLK